MADFWRCNSTNVKNSPATALIQNCEYYNYFLCSFLSVNIGEKLTQWGVNCMNILHKSAEKDCCLYECFIKRALKLIWGTCAIEDASFQVDKQVLLLLHLFLLKQASKPLDLAPCWRPMETKLICQPDVFSPFHLIKVKEIWVGYSWITCHQVKWLFQNIKLHSWLTALYDNGISGIFS